MKNYFLKSFVILCSFASVLTSCSDDNDSNPTIDEGESTGDYLPLAINNQWNYDNGLSILLDSQEEHDGHTYYMYSQQEPFSGTEASQGFRKSGASYYMYTADINYETQAYSQYIEGFEFMVLKDDLAVGESVTTEVSYLTETTVPDFGTTAITMNAEYTSTIDEKYDTYTINGQEYTDVIKVKVYTYASQSGQATEATTYYYFGKDVGMLMVDFDSAQSFSLTDYTLN